MTHTDAPRSKLGGIMYVIAILAVHIVDLANGFDRSDFRIFSLYVMLGVVMGFLMFSNKGLLQGLLFGLIISAVTWVIPLVLYLPWVRGFVMGKMLLKVTMVLTFCPVWLFALMYHMEEHEDHYGTWVRGIVTFYFLFLVIVTVFSVATTSGRMLLTSSSFKAPVIQAFWEFVKLVKQTLLAMFNGIVTGVGTAVSTIPKFVDGSISYATGDYYTGQVEKNKNEPLGVYLEDVETADPEYWEGDVVSVWGNIKAKTFDKPTSITLSCEAEDSQGNIYHANIVEPTRMPFVVTEYGEASFLCNFNSPRLPPEIYEVRVIADFNFETLAYLRTYLMRGESLLAKKKELRDNGQDYSNAGVLASYDLPANPIAIHTNGPVRIGIESFEPPIRVDPSSGVSPYLGVTIENAWPNGKIKRLTKLEFLVPQGIGINTGSCGNDHFSGPSPGSGQGEEGYSKYTYALNQDLKVNDITMYSSFRCLMNVDYTGLDNTPAPTVRTIKVNAGYNYAVEEALSVEVQSEEITI